MSTSKFLGTSLQAVAMGNNFDFFRFFLNKGGFYGNVQKQTGTKPVVLGLAFGYAPEALRPFVESLRAHYSGDAVLFTDGRADTAQYLASREITVVDCSKVQMPAVHLVYFRYFFYLLFLVERMGEFGRALITDVGDVIFQADPFAIGQEHSLYYFCEDPKWTIGNQPVNRGWMEACYGETITAAMADFPIVCGGTTLGGTAAMVQYLKLVIALADRLPQKVLETFGTDQAIHHFIVHLGLVNDSRILPNYGHIATLGLTPPEWISVDAGGNVLVQGHKSLIVHQYNYQPELLKRVRAKYP